ncbi:undecaprenyl-phosphate glucose phosphotransferase [Marinobacter sp. DY40_1A1]|uniref:undecaprenyl-phosphate glucose phosphotransferase n=1 Tax=Marinobacter sp. DY40_1A1 TaxID=2583229 RepID=UPI0019039E93|nr:undecaprenyl-phosphate glucose phosphotransferase [Marinobacter sp. DY40_1A1]MBK1885421.1 undecaprenyl-phosphate glucose phosphotransferase [Marinobacter sp. DY40_1A1]
MSELSHTKATFDELRSRRNKGFPFAVRASGGVEFAFWLQWVVATVVQCSVLIFLGIGKLDGDLASHYRLLALFSSLLAIPVFALFRAYSIRNGYLVGVARVLASWGTLIALLMFIAFATKTSDTYSREVVLQWILIGFAFQALAFVPLHKVLRRMDRLHRFANASVIVGCGDLALTLAVKLRHERGEAMIGLVCLDGDQPDNERPHTPYFPTLGVVSQLRSVISENSVSRVYIALPARETDQIEGLYVDLLDANVDVVWVPDFANLKLLNHSIHNLGGLPAINLNESPLTSYPGGAFLKSLMDRALALIGLLVLSPLMLCVAASIKLTSPGPVLFRQKRHGWNGHIIEVLKFRSMRVHDDSHARQAKKDDPRVTPVGRFLRRSSIDELPQLFNVLKGDMSLVGPRPHAVAHNDYYSDKIIAYMARHRIKPGITGLAQISGCRGETETIDKMQKRVELDLDYINHWSLWLDIKILIKTPLTLVSKDIY